LARAIGRKQAGALSFPAREAVAEALDGFTAQLLDVVRRGKRRPGFMSRSFFPALSYPKNQPVTEDYYNNS